MNKKLLVSVVVVIILVFGIWYLSKSNLKITPGTDSSDQTSNVLFKEIKIGDMVLSYPEDKIVVTNKENETRFTFNDLNFLVNGDEKYTLAYFSVFLNKDANKDQISIEAWLNEDNAEYSPQSPVPSNEEVFIIGNLKFHKHRISGFNPKYYDLVELYTTNKTDVYNISYYVINKDYSDKFNTEEQKSIENYEKIVDQIIQSIKFVD